MDGSVSSTRTAAAAESTAADSIVTIEASDVDALVERCFKVLSEQREEGQQQKQKQIFIGIAGTPGSGKSYVAERVRDAINERHAKETKGTNGGNDGNGIAAVVPMDGYHLTRQQLKEMCDENGGSVEVESDQWGVDDDSGATVKRKLTYDELMARRGSSFTYCPSSFVRDLKRAKEQGRGSFPIYDRSKHDPVPDGVRISEHNRIVLVEGLYLLCLDDPEWKEVGSVFDDRWYVDVSFDETKRRLVERHLRHWDDAKTEQWGGDGEQAAARKAEANDLLNAKCIRRHSRHNANVIVSNERISSNDCSH